MELEDYIATSPEGDIFIRGTRIGIETVLLEFLNGASPEEIAVRYRALTLLQVYAVITYYLHHQQRIDAYLDAYLHDVETTRDQQASSADELLVRLRTKRRESRKSSAAVGN